MYRPSIRAGFLLPDRDPRTLVRAAMKGAMVNKLVFAAFTAAGACFPFLLYLWGLQSTTLPVATALSILLVFGYTVLYSVQVVPAFVTSGSFTPLGSLPLSQAEVSTVAAFTLWRTMDVILAIAIPAQTALVAILSLSPVAVLGSLVASLAGELLAVVLALYLVSFFRRRLESNSISGARSLLRPLGYVLWGLSVMGAVFLFSLASFAAPQIARLLSGPADGLNAAAGLFFPLSAGLLVRWTSGTGGPQPPPLPIAGLVVTVLVAAVGSKGAFGLIRDIVESSVSSAPDARQKMIDFRLGSPFGAYVRKDLRVAARSPATGFIFALPIFEVVSVVLPLTAAASVKVSSVLVAVQVGGGFALFTAFLLVTIEDLGVERMSALPLLQRIRTTSKAIVSAATFVPVPVVMAILLSAKKLTFAGATLVPFSALLAVFAGCAVEVMVVRRLTQGGRGAAIRFIVGIGSGLLLLLVPALAYTFLYIPSGDHWVALAGFSLASALEGAAALFLARLER